MAATGLVLVLVALVWLAVRLTRRQIALSEFGESLSAGRRVLVALDPATGQVIDVSGELAATEASWHPVRFPEGWESRSAGFPSERVFSDRTMNGRRHWCEQRCRGGWRVERPESSSPVFWFEDRRDAADFTLAWFPFKCS